MNLERRERDWLDGWAARQHEVDDAYWRGVLDAQRAHSHKWQAIAERLSAISQCPPADVLAELRAQPERAQAIREFWTLTGLRDPRPPAPQVDPALKAAFIDRCMASWRTPREDAA
ncbi:hypothetical protein GCM10027586_06230 [Kineococcus gypseus]